MLSRRGFVLPQDEDDFDPVADDGFDVEEEAGFGNQAAKLLVGQNINPGRGCRCSRWKCNHILILFRIKGTQSIKEW